MEDKKKIVRQALNRKSVQQKVMEALAKKPTAAYLNNRGTPTPPSPPPQTTPAQQPRLVRNNKNRKRFVNRPLQVNNALDTRSDAYFYNPPKSVEYTTPEWFRSTEPADVSVIIPLYKSHEVIKDLIATWPLDNNGLKVEIIFVDDACPNNSKTAVLQAWEKRKHELKSPVGKLITNLGNGGYGQACNNGAMYATGKFFVFLNADTRVTQGWIEPMVELFADPDVGIVGNQHIKDGGGWSGTIDSAGSEWTWRENSFVHIGRHSYQGNHLPHPFTPENAPEDLRVVAEREMVTGCCFMIPAELFRYIGGFNRNYRIGYWEDADICLTVRELGYKIMYQPNSVIYHKLGHTGSGGHKHFQHNIKYFFNKWVHSKRIDPLVKDRRQPRPINRILLKRRNSHGDVLVAAGVCAALKEKYPGCHIMFSTLFPEVIQGNPYVDEFVDEQKIPATPHDLFFDFDLCYEYRPQANFLDAFAEECGVKREQCKVFLPQHPIEGVVLPEDYVIVHPGKTDWVGRNWPMPNFVEIANRLLQAGEKVVCVGKYTEGAIPCTLDLKGKTTIPQLAWVMSKAKLFVGIDSFPMNVAQATHTPGVAFFGCIKPETRIFTDNLHGVTAKDLPCLGCHHRKPVPSVATKLCDTITEACSTLVTVEDMWAKIQEVLHGEKNDRISLLG